MSQGMTIGGRRVGPGERCLVIAEAGVNHNGDVALAHQLVDAAGDAGADAVKFQAFNTDSLVTPDAPRAKYQAANTGSNDSQYSMLKALELRADDFAAVKRHCDDRGMIFLCTPFDVPSADMLAHLGVQAMKVPSGEVTNTLFLEHLAKLRLPLILSTGMATLAEIYRAVQTLRGDDPHAALVVLHCVTNYPAAPQEVNLRVMHTLARELDVATGLSDHTLGVYVAIAAAAMGACVIEKHFTLDRNLPGPDHRASLDPAELAQLVEGVRQVHLAMGDGVKQVSAEEKTTAQLVRRSVAAAHPIPRGTVLTSAMLTTLRPASGIPPQEAHLVIGQRAAVDIPARKLLDWEDLHPGRPRFEGTGALQGGENPCGGGGEESL